MTIEHPKPSADELLRQLGTSVLPVEDTELAAERRERVVPRLVVFAAIAKAEAQREQARAVLARVREAANL